MSELIKVTKDGEVIEVHPDALKNHQELGWVVVEEKPLPTSPKGEELDVVKPVEKKAKK
jgi:hypothetical protein